MIKFLWYWMISYSFSPWITILTENNNTCHAFKEKKGEDAGTALGFQIDGAK